MPKPSKNTSKSTARANRERETRRKGREALRDPEHVARQARRAAAAPTTSLGRFSLRNQMILSAQAEEKGLFLSDVDTYRGWERRGRKPARAGDYLLVTVPRGYQRKTADDQDDATNDDENEPPRAYFMGKRWDISQTVPLTDDDLAANPDRGACNGCPARAGQPCQPGCTCFACADPAPQQTPAEVLWNTLQNDITQSGYRFVWPGDPAILRGAAARVDHDAQTVHVSLSAAADPDGLATLAVVTAEVLNHPAAQRYPRRARALTA